MTDRDERAASLALREGEAKALRRAVDWYRTQDRLHCGDPITMAADAVAAYSAEIASGRDGLLVCDTTEMTDALNSRIPPRPHRPRRAHSHGRQRAAGDGGRRDHQPPQRPHHRIPLLHPNAESLPSVRNGNRWRVVGIDTKCNLVGAERLDDGARVLFEHEYLRRRHDPCLLDARCVVHRTECAARVR